MSGEALTFIEIDIPYCALTYGVAPCTASLTSSPPTGTAKCLNSLITCQDTANIDLQTVTLRFAVATSYLPRDIDIVASSVLSVEYSPAIVSLGENLGQRASIEVVFEDHPHSDAGNGFDKYHAERSYNPFLQGTFWGKFRARQPFLRGLALRWINGFVGQALAEMETRHFFVESFNGLRPDGKFSLVAKDALKFLDGDRAQAPEISNGFLVAAIDEDDGAATLSPSGIGDEEYPASGYANVGGNEVCYFSRDPYTKLLLHFDGSDAAVSTSDIDVANPHAVTFNGSAQLDTGQSKFGGSSLQLGAAGNYVSLADSDDWSLGTENLTIDCFIRFTTAPAGDAIIFWQELDASNYLYCGFASGNIFFLCEIGNVIQAYYDAPHGMSDNTWHHIEVVRSGSSFFIFRDGTALSLTTHNAIGSNSLGNIASTLRIGGTLIDGPGWVDEFRWRKGIADHTSGFTAPTVPYELTGTGDAIRLTRAQKGTTASAHAAQDRVQLCLVYEAKDPAFIINDLVTNYTDTPAGYVPLTEWETEVDNNLNRLYTATIAEPTAVNKLVSEVVQQGPLALWDDNVNQKLRLQVLRGIPTDAALYDESNVMRASFTVADQPEKRVSQVWVYYGQIDPTKRVDDPDNYRSLKKIGPSALEASFGQPAILKVFARWIPPLGSSTAETLGNKILSRYQIAPRKLGFDWFRDNVLAAPILGGGYRFEWWNLQEADGSRENVPIQVTRVLPDAGKIRVDAEEMLFSASADDLTNRHIVVDFNINNFNLKTEHDLLYPELEAGQTLTCTIAEGVTVGSTHTATPAFDVGEWAGTPDITIVNNGRIQGAGGAGGMGGTTAPGNGQPGLVGGPALYVRHSIDLTDTNGEIWGGGGGGGGGASGIARGGGGGGGAGKNPGAGGAPGGGGATAGGDGTTEAGGAAGTSGSGSSYGGPGGGPGLAGTAAPGGAGVGTPGAGGAPGAAIDGISLVTTVGAAGDRRGGTIN